MSNESLIFENDLAPNLSDFQSSKRILKLTPLTNLIGQEIKSFRISTLTDSWTSLKTQL